MQRNVRYRPKPAHARPPATGQPDLEVRLKFLYPSSVGAFEPDRRVAANSSQG